MLTALLGPGGGRGVEPVLGSEGPDLIRRTEIDGDARKSG